MVEQWLDQFGLGGLAGWAWGRYTALGGGAEAFGQIELEMVDRPEFEARFPAYKPLARRGRVMSPAEMISYEREAVRLMRSAGIPEGFYDQPSDIAGLMEREVSLVEVQQRVQLAAKAAFDAPAETKDALSRLYGVGDGDLVAFFLKPDQALPKIQQRWMAGQIAGAATKAGVEDLSVGQAERLAAAGVDEGAAQEGFQLLASTDLFDQQAGEQQSGDSFSQDERLGAVFGTDPASRRRLERKRRERQAAFEGGAGWQVGQQGVVGLATR